MEKKKTILIISIVIVVIAIAVVLYFLFKKDKKEDSLNEFSGMKETISLPSENKEIEYVVKDGDTLSGIAVKYGTTVDNLVKRNGIENPDLIIAGQTLSIGQTFYI